VEKPLVEYALVGVEVSGVQSFIFSTGKLKEMVGASQIIYEVTNDLYPEVLKSLDLRLVDEPQADQGWALAFQNKAGVLKILLPNKTVGEKFLTEFSKQALARWPSLPLNGALSLTAWNEEALRVARREISDKIEDRRARWPVPMGLALNPALEMSPLDGWPAVERERLPGKSSWISWSSSVKRAEKTIKAANERLKDTYNVYLTTPTETSDGQAVAWPKGVEPIWLDDFDEMLAGLEKPRLALIHFDVNDLGHFMFAQEGENSDADPQKLNLERQDKSDKIDCLNHLAFVAALRAAVSRDLSRKTQSQSIKDKQYLTPLRPLVMGGDDFTVLIRADLAFPFIQAFIETYESESLLRLGRTLTLGAGALIAPPSFPFSKASHLVEELVVNAKRATKNINDDVDEPRPSSLDYLVITADVEEDLDALRSQVAVNDDGSQLTGKPFILKDNFLGDFLRDAKTVLDHLPRSHTRGAINACRRGQAASTPTYLKLRENIRLGLGGRFDNKLLDSARFDDIFPPEYGFFMKQPGDNCQMITYLADYLELANLI
jgi:hypothetical protein